MPVVGFEAANLGREKSVVARRRPLAVDARPGDRRTPPPPRARSSARSPARDRIAVVAVGKQRGAADRLLVVDDRRRRRAAHDRGRPGPRAPRSTTPSCSRVAGARRRRPRDARARPAHGRAGGLERRHASTQAIAAAREADVAVYPIAIESPSFPPAPLKRLAEETGGRYAGASGTSAPARRSTPRSRRSCAAPGSSRTSPSARPGERLELAAAGATRRDASCPGVADRVDRRGVEAAGAALQGRPGADGAARRLLRPARGALRAARAARHAACAARSRRTSASSERKRARGPVQERFATASTRDAGDRAGLRPPQGLALRSTACSSGPTCRCARSSSSTPRPAPALLVGDRLRGRRRSPLVIAARDGRRRLAADRRRLVQGEAAGWRRSTTSCPTCWSRSPPR